MFDNVCIFCRRLINPPLSTQFGCAHFCSTLIPPLSHDPCRPNRRGPNGTFHAHSVSVMLKVWPPPLDKTEPWHPFVAVGRRGGGIRRGVSFFQKLLGGTVYNRALCRTRALQINGRLGLIMKAGTGMSVRGLRAGIGFICFPRSRAKEWKHMMKALIILNLSSALSCASGGGKMSGSRI